MQRRVEFAEPDSEEAFVDNLSVKDGGGQSGFETLVVMEFVSSVSTATTEWLLSKVQSPRRQGGGGLLARTCLNEKDEVDIFAVIIIHVTQESETRVTLVHLQKW